MKLHKIFPLVAVVMGGAMAMPAQAARGDRGGRSGGFSRGDGFRGGATYSTGRTFRSGGDLRVSRRAFRGGTSRVAVRNYGQTYSSPRFYGRPAAVGERFSRGWSHNRWNRHGWRHGRNWRGRNVYYSGGYYNPVVYNRYYRTPYYGYYNRYPYYSGYYDYYPTTYYTAPVARSVVYTTTALPAVASSTAVEVQIALKRKGYYRGAIDGIIGPQTRRAIRAYQIDHGLPVTRRIDSYVLRSLQLA